ncbi:hypothetical protein [Serratia proteamaculans]|uniref:Uncharacterized protein n=1 Tax=Serratia proteamaculans TaxID=28151 RepID=A0A5Q2V9B6_SERPR|nr:hypothetical protein [Serratia proteamaculans]QGH60774.1 hypothetical protein GHV41_07915 [Serratia proteamaculans]
MNGAYRSLDALVQELVPHALVKVSEHTSIYRGFCITRIPRKKVNPVTRYHVSQGDQSYGKFDAQAEATGYIDGLYEQSGVRV